MSEARLSHGNASEADYLEDNIATVAFHLGQPGAKLSIRSDKDALMVDPGEVLAEISRRLTAPAQGSPMVAHGGGHNDTICKPGHSGARGET